MEFSISTPALLFSAISLFMLSFTNRFHTVASLIRTFIASYNENPDSLKLRQIRSFKYRLKLIQFTQGFGVFSFLLCAISMALFMLKFTTESELIFLGSLLSLISSLVFALLEITNSIAALKIELEKINCEGNKCG